VKALGRTCEIGAPHPPPKGSPVARAGVVGARQIAKGVVVGSAVILAPGVPLSPATYRRYPDYRKAEPKEGR
jgi:hypothetical protein